jgi:hypothetical protein
MFFCFIDVKGIIDSVGQEPFAATAIPVFGYSADF